MPEAAKPAESTQVRFRLRGDLKVSTQTYGGALCYVLKDPVTLAYFRFRPAEYRVLQLIQGVTISQLCDLVVKKLGEERPQEKEIEQFFGQLLASGLITRDAGAPEGSILHERKLALERKKRRSMLGSITYIKFPGIDPEPILKWLYPKVRWLFSKPGVTAAVALWLFAAGYTLINLDQFIVRLKNESLESFFTWDTLLLLWITLGLSKIIHEFGHGLTCKHFGGECHDMGMLLLVFSPALFCDTTDAWTMPNKWHRIAISAAGIYVELVLASISCLVWWFTEPGGAHRIALAIMTLCSLTTFLVNANPLMRYDGYYVMSDWLEIPNLRAKSAATFQAMVDKHLLGLADTQLPQVDGPRWMFLLYATLAWFYRWFLCAMILWFFYNVLKPYRLGSLSIALAWFVGFQMFVMPMWSGIVRLKKSSASKRRIQWWRAGISGVALAGIIAFIVLAPVPRRVKGLLTVQGVGQTSVFVPVPGRLSEIDVQPGQKVEAGAVLVKLENPELDDQIQYLQHRRNLLDRSAEKYFSLSLPGEEQHLTRLRGEIDHEIETRNEQKARLVIRAEQGGLIVAAPETPHYNRETQGFTELSNWQVHPLRVENLGSRMMVGTHLCEIQPSDQFEAVMLVEQTEVAFLEVGQPVAFKLDSLPETTLRGHISDIAHIEAEQPPHQLFVTKGGELPAKFGTDGSIKLPTTYYEVRALLETADQDETVNLLLRSGFRGRARIECGVWTCWDYLIRQFNKIFHM